MHNGFFPLRQCRDAQNTRLLAGPSTYATQKNGLGSGGGALAGRSRT